EFALFIFLHDNQSIWPPRTSRAADDALGVSFARARLPVRLAPSKAADVPVMIWQQGVNTVYFHGGDEMDSFMTQPLDSRQLRAFVTLARRASFTRAAKDLCLSQSAVSHSMKALEMDLGCRLFDRVSKRISLTEAGEQLLEH